MRIHEHVCGIGKGSKTKDEKHLEVHNPRVHNVNIDDIVNIECV